MTSRLPSSICLAGNKEPAFRNKLKAGLYWIKWALSRYFEDRPPLTRGEVLGLNLENLEHALALGSLDLDFGAFFLADERLPEG